MIRVGRCRYDNTGKRTDPSYPDFTPIVVLMKGHNQYGVLGPYLLKDDQGRILENIWQFSKVYKKVPATTQYYSRYNKTITWKYPEEKHIDDNGQILPAYWQWRNKGMSNLYAIRYPVGIHHMHECLYAIKDDNIENKLDYIEARKQIYVPIYCELAKKESLFSQLQNRLESGENLLIIEVDGPHQESLEYYMNEYDVNESFIENDTMLATDENLMIMLNDDKHAFGHGYCLAMALLDLDEDLIQLLH